MVIEYIIKKRGVDGNFSIDDIHANNQGILYGLELMKKDCFYLALVLKFYLALLIGIVIFNKTKFKFKIPFNALIILVCIRLSLLLGIEGSIFFEEAILPSLLFFIELLIYICLYYICKMFIKIFYNKQSNTF